MAISKGISSISLEDVLKVTSESDIAYQYLGVTEIPIVINSPLRIDNKPSLGLYSNDGKRIHYVDFSTGDRGGLFDLLCQMWNIGYREVLSRIYNDCHSNSHYEIKLSKPKVKINIRRDNSSLQVKTRDWEDYDIRYWESYGVTLEWLKYGDVYPISYKIITKGSHTYTFKADKLAYAFIERKEGKVSIKIYQPLNKAGFKWCNSHDRSVISLWSKIPEYGDKVIICSSLKDALCVSNNLRIPALAVQGEGYGMSETAINELKRRYNKVYVSFDTDEVGLADGEKFAKETGFINIVPDFGDSKDFSDYYHSLKDKKEFLKLKELFI